MCGIVVPIAMLIFGIIALVRGHFLLTRVKEVRGWPARIIGFLLIAPFPLSALVGMVLGAVFVATGKNLDHPGFKSSAQIAQSTISVCCCFSAIGVAMFFAEPIRKKRPEQIDAVIPGDYDERFQARQRDTSENQDITGEVPRPSTPPDDRIQS